MLVVVVDTLASVKKRTHILQVGQWTYEIYSKRVLGGPTVKCGLDSRTTAKLLTWTAEKKIHGFNKYYDSPFLAS